MRIALLVLPILSSCSLVVERDDEVTCLASECPSSDDIADLLRRFDARVPGFDGTQHVAVEWHPPGTTWEIGEITATAYSYPWASPPKIVATEPCSVFHELMHVYLYQATGDEDPTHETPPGPWDAAATMAEDELCAVLLAEVTGA